MSRLWMLLLLGLVLPGCQPSSSACLQWAVVKRSVLDAHVRGHLESVEGFVSEDGRNIEVLRAEEQTLIKAQRALSARLEADCHGQPAFSHPSGNCRQFVVQDPGYQRLDRALAGIRQQAAGYGRYTHELSARSRRLVEDLVRAYAREQGLALVLEAGAMPLFNAGGEVLDVTGALVQRYDRALAAGQNRKNLP
jgi:hypothetical protein